MFITFAYASRVAPTTMLDDVLDICVTARRRNPAREITGVLYYNGQAFFQVLEGETAAVDALVEEIRADPRHRDFRQLLRCPVRQRLFGAWSMKYVNGCTHSRRRLNPTLTAEAIAAGNEAATLTRIFALRSA